MTGTSGEVHLHHITEDLVEQCLDGLLADHLARDMESQRVDTLVEDIERLGIGSLRIFAHHNVLTNVPRVRVLLVTTHERELTGECIGGFQIRQVFTAIEGLYIKTFIGSPYQTFLEVGTFQIDLNLIKPFLGGRRSKLGKEFLFICHSSTINYYISLF